MKLRSKLLLPILGLVCLGCVSAFTFLSYKLKHLTEYQSQQIENLAELERNQSMQTSCSVFENTIEQITDTALKQASLLSAQPQVIKAYELAMTGNIDDPNDPLVQEARQMLRRELASLVKQNQQVQHSLKIHFHLPNARSLVRLWRENWNATRDGQKVDISDDLASFRRTVVQINKQPHRPIKGIEIGRGGFAIRGIMPITNPQGKHMGSVEVLYPFSDATRQLDKHADAGLAVFMKSEFLNIATKLQDTEKFPTFENQFVQCAMTNAKILKPMINAKLLTEGLSQLSVQPHHQYALASWPIRDFSDQIVGTMVMSSDTTLRSDAVKKVIAFGKAQRQSLNRSFGLGMIGIGLMISLVMTVIIRKFVLKPVNNLVQTLGLMAKGDLSHCVPEESRDELGQLGKCFNQFIAQFSHIIHNVIQASHEVTSAASQIDASSQQMVSGINDQTSQVTQISAAIAQMNASSSEVASKTSDASSLATQSGQAAKDGGRVVEENIKGMQAINQTVTESSQMVTALGQRSEQIGEIIKVINEIADQTNLLALNAAIEAARAGEHGRGFAVVADEVRKLADRTTKATEEVAHSITAIQSQTENAVACMHAGTQQVDHGVNCASEAGESLSTIVNKAQAVTEMIQAIAAAANEQSQASDQISRNVESIIHVSRNASDGATQTATAASQLTCKAHELQELVRQFKLPQSGQCAEKIALG